MEEVIKFPVTRTKKKQEEKVEKVMEQDPYYTFIRDLLDAISKCGLDIGDNPSDKAKELYAKYQQDNTLAELKNSYDPT